MADTKRASMNKVATPRLPSNQALQLLRDDNSIARTIGAKIRITTSSNPPRTHEGYLFSAHAPSNLLSLTPTYPPSPNTTPALTILPISTVQNVTVITPAQQPLSSSIDGSLAPQNSTIPSNGNKQQASSSPAPASLPVLPPLLDPATQQARVRAAISRVQAEDARRGKGVTKEAQDIFDALSRTLPTQWDGENILVLGQVLIAKPYNVEDCKAGKEVQTQMLQRIKKVLENERKKIAEKTGATPVVRKGG